MYDENVSTFFNQRRVAVIIAHELSHQWFGNIVSPTWYSYAWLSEGFATLLENYATEWLFPEWKILDAFGFSFVQNVMVPDATNATRPMTQYAESADGVSKLFDNIAYAKCK